MSLTSCYDAEVIILGIHVYRNSVYNFIFYVQYAHRACVQRWCNEKGDTTCEIFLCSMLIGESQFYFTFSIIFATSPLFIFGSAECADGCNDIDS